MVSRFVRTVKKKPSSCKASAAKPKVRPERAAAAAKDTSTKSVLKRPSRAASSVPTRSDWCEFTPQTINEQCCLARTWDDGHGGQCTRHTLNDATQLCAAHERESELPLGLAHGLVTGEIPARKLEQFKRVRTFREAARVATRLELAHSSDTIGTQEAAIVADADVAPANVSSCYGNGQPRSVQCWRAKRIMPRLRPGTCVKGGKTFSREHLEQLAMQASNDAADYLFQRTGYPTPLLGSLQCTLIGFERDLDGIRPNTICIFEWRFSHGRIEGIETTHRVKHKCRNLFYKRNLLRPPSQVRMAACVARPLVNTAGV